VECDVADEQQAHALVEQAIEECGGSKMGKRSRLYSPEFKEEALRPVHSSEERYPVANIARDLDLSAETLRKWVNQAEIDSGERDELTTEAREELSRLRRKNRILREENHHPRR
jgi:transposase